MTINMRKAIRHSFVNELTRRLFVINRLRHLTGWRFIFNANVNKKFMNSQSDTCSYRMFWNCNWFRICIDDLDGCFQMGWIMFYWFCICWSCTNRIQLFIFRIEPFTNQIRLLEIYFFPCISMVAISRLIYLKMLLIMYVKICHNH